MNRPLHEYPSRSTDKLRYGDTDRQGHVNNAHFATFLETGRVEILYDPERPLVADGTEIVIARLALDFLGEIHWPGTVAIGTGVKKIGTSSLTLVQTVYQDEQPVAHAETVLVQIDSQTRDAAPLSDGTRARLRELHVETD